MSTNKARKKMLPRFDPNPACFPHLPSTHPLPPTIERTTQQHVLETGAPTTQVGQLMRRFSSDAAARRIGRTVLGIALLTCAGSPGGRSSRHRPFNSYPDRG